MTQFHREEKPKSEFEERVVSVDRVSYTVAGGRRLRFRALVVVGDRQGRVGMGVAKSGEVQTAVQKAVAAAKKRLVTVPIVRETIPHAVTSRFGSAYVLLKPARPGTSVIAGGSVRAVIELAGIKNILSKSLGSNNKINIVTATIEALKALRVPSPASVTSSQVEATVTGKQETSEVTSDESKVSPASAKKSARTATTKNTTSKTSKKETKKVTK